jgi:uncharacterized membrane protein
MTTLNEKGKYAWLLGVHPVTKMLVCLVIALFVFLMFPLSYAGKLSRIMLAWDVFSFCYLLFYWAIFYTTSHWHIRKQAAEEDSSRAAIFIIILICTLASMLAVVLLLITKNESSSIKALHLVLAFLGMTFSWSLVHTIFAVRYAHLYYANKKGEVDAHAGGLDFPDSSHPDFLDFAYFSFVLGMTFQVSDVSITSRKLRRIVMWHSLISFGYNVVIIALTINVIAGLTG